MRKQKKIVGTLLPLSSLKKANFIEGQKFLDWLSKTKQTAWQLLPLHETQLEPNSRTKHVPSPYKSYGIGLDPQYLTNDSSNDLLQKEEFLTIHKDWIFDYALFCSLRDEFGTDDWRQWEEGLRKRDKRIIDHWQKKLEKETSHYITIQWQLHMQYAQFRAYAHSLEILLFGDLPYYPTVNSPLVWAHQDAFLLNEDGSLPFVSGIPDSLGTHYGRQVWGHPLYAWETQREKVMELWELRFRYLSSIFHSIRFDHTKAFFAYGAMDIHNSENDRYEKGPGDQVFRELVTYASNQGLTIYAEDSGEGTAELRRILDDEHIPGIRIFRFAMKNEEILKRYACVSDYPNNCVAFTSTHDTEPILAYIQTLNAKQKKKLASCVNVPYTTDRIFARDLRNAVLSSPAKIVIIPIQDWLLLTDRINIPGTEKEVGDTNWQFKLPSDIEELPLLEDLTNT